MLQDFTMDGHRTTILCWHLCAATTPSASYAKTPMPYNTLLGATKLSM